LGRHKAQNPRGSPSGRKLAGDALAEKVHGRKGMHKDRREKGISHKTIKGPEAQKAPLSDDQFQVLWLLFTRHRFSHPGLPWDDLLLELELIDIPEARADDFMRGLSERVGPWLVYMPGFGVYLSRTHIDDISAYLRTFLEARKGSFSSGPGAPKMPRA